MNASCILISSSCAGIGASELRSISRTLTILSACSSGISKSSIITSGELSISQLPSNPSLLTVSIAFVSPKSRLVIHIATKSGFHSSIAFLFFSSMASFSASNAFFLSSTIFRKRSSSSSGGPRGSAALIKPLLVSKIIVPSSLSTSSPFMMSSVDASTSHLPLYSLNLAFSTALVLSKSSVASHSATTSLPHFAIALLFFICLARASRSSSLGTGSALWRRCLLAFAITFAAPSDIDRSSCISSSSHSTSQLPSYPSSFAVLPAVSSSRSRVESHKARTSLFQFSTAALFTSLISSLFSSASPLSSFDSDSQLSLSPSSLTIAERS
mmetsp:Transcript_3282/g.6411  ORF Transcript_3282/g.6411 Transcript_3282/m.6411 type:complete len:327 (-) Transcript_3282:20-1000(-)